MVSSGRASFRCAVYARSVTSEPLLLIDSFAPFKAGEVRQLRRYLQVCDQLVDSAWGQDGTLNFHLGAHKGERVEMRIEYPGEEALRSFLVLLRQLYLEKEQANFAKVAKLLRSHARVMTTSAREATLAAIDHHRNAYRNALLHPMIGMKDQSTPKADPSAAKWLTAKEILDDYLYGEHFHWDEDRARRLEHWERVPLHRYNFLATVNALASVCISFSGIVMEILGEPSLLLN